MWRLVFFVSGGRWFRDGYGGISNFEINLIYNDLAPGRWFSEEELLGKSLRGERDTADCDVARWGFRGLHVLLHALLWSLWLTFVFRCLPSST